MKSKRYDGLRPGPLGWLTIIFIVMKWVGVINWGWWFVFLPIIIPIIAIFIVIIIRVTYALLTTN